MISSISVNVVEIVFGDAVVVSVMDDCVVQISISESTLLYSVEIGIDGLVDGVLVGTIVDFEKLGAIDGVLDGVSVDGK